MAIKTIKKANEDEAQAHICSWCLQNGLIPVAVVNGINLNAAMSIFKENGLSLARLKAMNAKQIALLKKEGLHSGFPDLLIVGNTSSREKILFMENKVKGNKPSDLQLACHDWLRSLGFTVEVSKNSIDAIAKIRAFFEGSEQKENRDYISVRKFILNRKKEVENENNE